MFEPITFPNARSAWPSKADLILTINSGAEVANETTVIPITIFGICNLKEKPTADFNSQFPPKINNTKPIAINSKFIKKYLCKYNRIIIVLNEVLEISKLKF
ncbi:hypothetical protein GCM10007963_13350 [Lutibacter litoralis]|nr:hypothetical protein GCM10007963_13350 [Lutibacter litoralis]